MSDQTPPMTRLPQPRPNVDAFDRSVRPHAEQRSAPGVEASINLCRTSVEICDYLRKLEHSLERSRAAGRRLGRYWQIQCDGEVAVREMFRAHWASENARLRTLLQEKVDLEDPNAVSAGEKLLGCVIDLDHCEDQLQDSLSAPGFAPIASNAKIAIRCLRIEVNRLEVELERCHRLEVDLSIALAQTVCEVKHAELALDDERNRERT